MKPKPLFIFFLLLSLVSVGCGEDPQPVPKGAPQPPGTPQIQSQSQAPTQAAERSNVWPFLSAGQLEGSLAENPMARNFFLIFDGSGSMDGNECSGGSRKIDAAKKAVTAWSESVPADANLGLYAFHNPGYLTLPLASGNRDAFMQKIDEVMAGGKTPLTEAMNAAFDALTAQGRRQLGYGEYTIVVVTDGIANSVSDLRRKVNAVLENSPINIYSIGFCIGERHSLNQPGRTMYKSADNPEQLQQGLQEVLAESETFDEQEFKQ